MDILLSRLIVYFYPKTEWGRSPAIWTHNHPVICSELYPHSMDFSPHDQSSLLQLPFRNGSCIRSTSAFRNPLRGKRAFQLISLMTGGDWSNSPLWPYGPLASLFFCQMCHTEERTEFCEPWAEHSEVVLSSGIETHHKTNQKSFF